jgi:hypothetical protein
MAKKTTATASATKVERKIPIDKLRRSSFKLFGVTPSTFDGATVGLTGTFTVEEMQARIDAWLNTPVNLGQKKED